jgi:prepilin peptidase CpaA
MIMIAVLISLLFFPTLMAFAASSDLLTMEISNKISALLAVGFVLLAVGTGMPAADLLRHFCAGGLVLSLAFICFWRGWIGGGDAKLAAATALWLGFDQLLNYFVYASLFGGVLTLVLLQYRKLPLPGVLARQPWAARLHEPSEGVPYGIALAIAALVLYPSTAWIRALSA